jgi:uncharacterized protein YabE (DUF348 family)
MPLETQPATPTVSPRRAAPAWRRFIPLGAALALLAACAVCALVALSAAAAVPPSLDITLALDGDARVVTTRAATVSALLAEQNIALSEGDVVAPGLAAALTDGALVRVSRARSVTLVVDGAARSLRTHLTSPAAILASAGYTLSARDRVTVDGTAADPASLDQWPVPASQISVRRALPVRIDDDGALLTVETASETVGEALFEAGITLYLADTVTPDLSAPVVRDMQIIVGRSRLVTISADGAAVETRASGGTVADALAEAGIALVGQDYTIPADSVPLLPGMRIRVIRVTEETLFERETLPYVTIYQADPALELDQRAVVQAGQAGLRQTTIRVRRENGFEISRTVEESGVLQEPVDEVITYGTNVVLRSVDTPEGPRQYWRRLRMYATSYHPEALGGDSITAIGETLRKGIVGSDPRIIPYRSQVYVPGYGVGMMADTGSFPRPLWIDLGYDDDNWVSWARYVDVYLLAPVPDNIEYLLPG